MRFINALVACSVIAITSSSVLAQSTAVQWTTASGGNGHWYEVATTPRTFFQARDWAVDNGGSLALIDSSQENQFLFQLVLSTTGSWSGAGPFFGLFQDPSNPSFSEPNGGWIWVDGTPRSGRFDSFCGGQPDNSWGGQSLAVYWAPGGSPQSCWDDDIAWTDLTTFTGTHLIEWSADCNADGIVDYGQSLSGQLTDANSNGIPDSCEVGPCPGDISGNGAVDGVDLTLLLGVWGTDGIGGGLPLESRTPPVGRIAPARRSVFHVHDASLYP